MPKPTATPRASSGLIRNDTVEVRTAPPRALSSVAEDGFERGIPRSRTDPTRPSGPALIGRAAFATVGAAMAVGSLVTPSTAVAEVEHVPAGDTAPTTVPKINEDLERRHMRAAGGPTLIDLTPDTATNRTTVTVHGINSNPSSVHPLNVVAAESGDHVATFAYDDQRERLTKTSDALAAELRTWRKAHPGESLSIDAHSMGGRVVLGALDRLHRSGDLDFPVNVRLIAPPLGGYDSANGARKMPRFLSRLIKGVNPGKDMGTRSKFQKNLESLDLPAHVKTSVFVGTHDDIVDYETDHFAKVVEALGAKVYYIKGARHDPAINSVATGKLSSFSTTPLPRHQ